MYFEEAFRALGFAVDYDPVGNFIAQNRPRGTRVFGLGSHCDSNRNGGKWDGTLRVVVALEVCRLASEHRLDLPLRVISFLEEEGSGFGQMVLGSQICAGRIEEDDLTHNIRSLDDGRPFLEHAREAGYAAERWRECSSTLDDLVGWVECHIEQGRVLQDNAERIGIVDTIAGYVHADIEIRGADHAGATPMDARSDALAVGAQAVVTVERLASAHHGTVGTVGELEVVPGLINAVPGRVRLSLDIRGVDESAFHAVVSDTIDAVERAAADRGAEAPRPTYTERQTLSVTHLDDAIVAALDDAAGTSAIPHRRMHSGAAHDTMCVADRAPCAMVFVPCRDGISHAPEEDSDPADAAIAAEIILRAVRELAS